MNLSLTELVDRPPRRRRRAVPLDASAIAAVTVEDRRIDLALLEPEQRLSALFEHSHRRIYRLARRLANNAEEADDLVQETFLRAAKHRAKLPTTLQQAEAWLVRTVVNLCRDRHRHRLVWQRIWPHLDRRAARVVDWEDAAVARQAVGAALRGLPPKRRAVVILCELEGLASREAAALLGIRDVTVRWHLSAARKELATLLLADRSEPAEVP